jgi:GT2 family glycosyltransferase
LQSIGVVLIGRNEGERLIRSLNSVIDGSRPVVYVDSGSTDGSCEAARERGAEVVELDLSIPFTAARARNAGFQYLRQHHPDVEWVQFIDGDCEVVQGWIEAAAQTLRDNPKAVAVCGYRRERYPEKTVYNRICDIEWQMGPIGEVTHFGGDVMISAIPLEAIGGYNNNVIAAEDDEVSVRLRQAGGKILRIDRVSTLHDADMHSVSQWWKRAIRCGYGFALVSSLHGASPERKFVKEVTRTLIWGLGLPLVALILAIPTRGLSLLLLARYPLSAVKIIASMKKQGYSQAEAIAWGISCATSAFPNVIGIIKFYLDRVQNKQYKIIEYKGAQASATK